MAKKPKHETEAHDEDGVISVAIEETTHVDDLQTSVAVRETTPKGVALIDPSKVRVRLVSVPAYPLEENIDHFIRIIKPLTRITTKVIRKGAEEEQTSVKATFINLLNGEEAWAYLPASAWMAIEQEWPTSDYVGRDIVIRIMPLPKGKRSRPVAIAEIVGSAE